MHHSPTRATASRSASTPCSLPEPLLSALEVAAGVALPARRRAPSLPRSVVEPAAALEQAVLRALTKTPCVVSFSGGRDSSLVLAAATAVARREGLPLPIPVTVRVQDDRESAEREWQELVIDHLGLDDWVRVEVGHELDCIGPIAQEVLRSHGLLWPANVHFHVPQFDAARGGSLLTGIGGDEVFSRTDWARLRRLLALQVRPEPRDARRVAAALAPRLVRRRVIVGRSELDLGWLRPTAQREVLARLADESAAEPVGWRRRFRWLLGLSYLEVGTKSLDLLARDWNVEVGHPLLDAAFVGSLAALPRERRFDGRTDALTTLFPHLLPERMLSRTSKAVFGGALWGAASRTFASSWDGSGVDAELVDVDALMERWQRDDKPGPYTLLQSLWLAQDRTSSSVSSDSGSASNERGRRSSQAGNALN